MHTYITDLYILRLIEVLSQVGAFFIFNMVIGMIVKLFIANIKSWHICASSWGLWLLFAWLIVSHLEAQVIYGGGSGLSESLYYFALSLLVSPIPVLFLLYALILHRLQKHKAMKTFI
jgi:hypothetical protein